ncbi:MAG: hypothetical protein WCO86_12905, partial [Planctomycetota bacterium]
MATTAYKRFRMQIELQRTSPKAVRLPAGYRWLPWRSLLLERHAQVKWRAFREDLDGKVFSCLGDAAGCTALMKEIVGQAAFCRAATWMAPTGRVGRSRRWPSRRSSGRHDRSIARHPVRRLPAPHPAPF